MMFTCERSDRTDGKNDGNKSGQLVITYTAVVNKDIIDMGNKVTSGQAAVSRTPANSTPIRGCTVSEAMPMTSRRSEVPRVRGNRGFADPAQVHQDCGWRIPPCRSERERRCRGCGNHHRRRENHGLEVRQVHAKETGFASGYTKNFVPIFNVELAVNHETGKSTFRLVGASNLGLASRLADKAIQVKNVMVTAQWAPRCSPSRGRSRTGARAALPVIGGRRQATGLVRAGESLSEQRFTRFCCDEYG